ncbi:cardiolipin synthase [Streptococcus sp. DD13]|uniref:cardiolipin synthase n=1 Tax=Streptococcus sp. DD13 TaxID=1777881 RepID=UPI000795A2BB|nr:cardiolipin synthase [Streptococcus sp. DD13]KXT79127.1 Cardiolipin synthetase [Streptococcus sp. DD13]
MKRIWRLIYSRAFFVILSVFLTIWFVIWSVSMLAGAIPVLWILLQLFSAAVALHIVNRPMNAAFKLTWAVFVLAVPVFGAIFYFIMRTNLEVVRYRRTFKRQSEVLRAYMKDHDFHSDKAEKVLAKQDPEQLRLLSYMDHYVGYPMHVNSDAVYYPSGEAMFEELLLELNKAERYIFMEYYIVDFGYMWDQILALLKEKVAQGVEVRFMYDGMNSLTFLPYHYYKTLQDYGIQAKVFSQIIPALSTVQNNRDHRKITVIDGKVAFTGGVNLADEYINRIERFGYWKDAAIKVTGEAVSNFTLMFLQMWNFNNKHPNEDLHFLQEQISQKSPHIQSDAVMQAYGENPFNDEEVAKRVYLDLIQSAQESIDVMTPYLVLDDETMDNLTYAAKRGVKVRFLLPGIYDKQSAYLAARTDFEVYLEAGIEIYEFNPGFVHSKVMLVDGKRATVGSVNMDFRSLYLNFECGLYIYNHPQVLAAIQQDFEDSYKRSNLLTLEEFQKNYPWYKRIAGHFMKIFSPLL